MQDRFTVYLRGNNEAFRRAHFWSLGRECSCEVEVIKDAEGRVLHGVDECGDYHKNDKLLGFAGVKLDALPPEFQYYASITNSKQPIALCEAIVKIHWEMRDKEDEDFEFTWPMMRRLRKTVELPDFVWLGVVPCHGNRLSCDEPQWAVGIEFVESSGGALRYAPATTDLSDVAKNSDVYMAVHGLAAPGTSAYLRRIRPDLDRLISRDD